MLFKVFWFFLSFYCSRLFIYLVLNGLSPITDNKNNLTIIREYMPLKYNNRKMNKRCYKIYLPT